MIHPASYTQLQQDRAGGQIVAPRSGLQLLELTISMAMASILLAGTATSIYLASKANGSATTALHHSCQTELGIDQLALDLSLAKRIDFYDSSNVTIETFAHDGQPIVAEYGWAGPGNPLALSVDGASRRAITPPMDEFNFKSREYSASDLTPEPTVDESIYLENVDSKSTLLSDHVLIDVPKAMMPGDLMVVMGAIATSDYERVVADEEWSQAVVQKHPTSNLTLCAFYRTTVPTEISKIYWDGWASSYFLAAQFRGSSQELKDVLVTTGDATTLECPSMPEYSTLVNVIRVAASGCSIVPDATNMLDFARVGIEREILLDLTIASAYKNSRGGEPVGAFQMAGSGPFVSATLVFSK